MNRDDLVQALAVVIALEQPSVAAAAAAQLPDFLDILDVLRASDGLQQLARALDARRRPHAA